MTELPNFYIAGDKGKADTTDHAANIERVIGNYALTAEDKARLEAAAEAIERLERAGRELVIGWREWDYPEGFDRFTAEVIAERYRAALNRREGDG